jgi:uncharacterized protein YeeX (DUF496 family)
MPPIQDKDEIDDELRKIQARYPLLDNCHDSLKRSCALEALDAVILDMQKQYDQVCRSYFALKNELSR